MTYLGDLRLGDTIDCKFCTVTTTGAPTQLAGSPVVSAYPGNSTTQLTAGITLSVDFDSVTGLNNVRVVATSGNGYATATNYQLVITTGTVGGTSVVGYVIGQFSIEARSALMPTVAARTLDVSAGGEGGVDWANVGTPGSTVGLSATTVAAVTTTATATAVTTVNGLAAGVITAASIAAAALNGKGDWNIGKTGYALSAAGIQAIWDALTSALTTVGSIGKLIVDNLNATISSRMATYVQPTGFLAATFPGTVASPTNITAGVITTVTNLTNAPTAGDFTAVMKTSIGTSVAGSAVASVTGNVGGNVRGSVGSVVGAVGSVTGSVGGNVTGSVGSVVGAVGSVTAPVTTTAADRIAVADALLDRDMSTGVDSGSPTVRTPRQALRFNRNKWSIASGTLTVTKEDDATPSWTATVTQTAGNPVSTIDPA